MVPAIAAPAPDSTVIPLPSDECVQFAPYVLLRVAALPYELLMEMHPKETETAIEAWLEAQSSMESLRPGIEVALFAEVPRLDRSLRAEALKVRRAAHKCKRCSISDSLIETLARSSPETARMVRAWSEASATCDRMLERAERALAEETDSRIYAGLEAVSRDEQFLRALVISSPDLYSALERHEWIPFDAGPKAIRSVLSYAIRGAAKTSPFSVFMHQAVLWLDMASQTELPRIERCSRRSQAGLNIGIPWLLRNQSSRWILNRRLRWIDGTVAEIRVPRISTVGGRLWRSEDLSRIRFSERIVSLLRDIRGEISSDELFSQLQAAGLDEQRAEKFAAKLMQGGLLIPVESGTVAAECEIAAELALNCSGADSHERFEVVQEVGRLINYARFRATQRNTHVDQALMPDIQSLIGILEDGYFEQTHGPVGGQLAELLKELGGVLRLAIVKRSPYLALQDLFVKTFGVGGASEAPAFLEQADRELRSNPPRWVLGREQPANPRESTARLTALVQFRIESGEPLAIVNQVHTGCGWLTARHGMGDAADAIALRRRQADWIQRTHLPNEAVDIPVCADCNPLQKHPRLTARYLRWPGEPSFGAGEIPISDVCIVHDVKTDLLQLLHQDVILNPLYLGGTLPSPIWGPVYWLTVLGEPFGIDVPLETILPPPDGASDVEFRPRRQLGRIVLSRASWCLRSCRLSEVWFRQTGVKRLAAVTADLNQLGMPRQFFARAILDLHNIVAGDLHKPLWVDAMNPICLDLMHSLVERTEWIVCSEILPEPGRGWSPFPDQSHVFEMLVEMEV